MNKLKCFALAVVMTLLSALTLSAQKPYVYVSRFDGDREADEIRENIISGLSATSRLNIVGKNSEPDYVIEGYMHPVKLSYYNNDDEGRTSATVKVTLRVYSQREDKLVYSEDFSHYATSKGQSRYSENAAINSAVGAFSSDMKDFVDAVFKCKGKILQFDEVKMNKNNEGDVKKLYIDLGSQLGMLSGQKLDVYYMKDIQGNLSKQVIGELKITNVEGGTLSLCKVTKHGKEIYKAQQEGVELYVVTKVNTNIFGF